jgi:hypothetical protein
MEEDVVVQALVQEHGANIEDQVNDPMEEDDDANNTVEEDGTNILIQETFNNVGMDDDDTNLMVFLIYLYLRRKVNLFMKAPKQVFSLLYCCW